MCLMVNLQFVPIVNGLDPTSCNQEKGSRQLRKAVVYSFESIHTSLSGFLERCQTGLNSEKDVGFLLTPFFPFRLVGTA